MEQYITKSIQSLDTLNDQIVEFIFSGTELDDSHGGSPKQREALKASMSLMRRLLVDAQSKFRKMVEDNKQLASRIDGDLQTAHQEVNLLRQELADTNRRITQLQAHNQNHDDTNLREDEDSGSDTTVNLNGSNKYHSESSSNQLAEEMSQLRVDNEKLLTRNRSLQREVEELRRVKTIMEEDVQLKPQINQMTMELTHAKEALSALKADRKRLKAEKFDLLNQMKQLYATLEDKEKELRDFIRNYEQRMKESDESLRQLAAERDETEREKWNILKHARDESERVVKLSAELGVKETTIRKLQEELDAVRKQLISMGYHSDAESVRTNGLPTPTASTPACSPLPLSTPTPTPNGRGSSADSLSTNAAHSSQDVDAKSKPSSHLRIPLQRGCNGS